MHSLKRIIVILCSSLLIFSCDASTNLSSYEYTSNAKEYLDKGELQVALIELKNALQKDPDNTEARLLLGQLHVTLGDGASAEKELNRAIALGANVENFQPFLARALLLQAKYEAVSELVPANDLSPAARAELHALRGMALLNQQELEEAEAEFDKALVADSNSVEAMVGKARLAAMNGDVEQARQDLKRAFAIDKLDAAAWSLLGEIEQYEGNLDAAEQAYSMAADNRVANTADLLNRIILRIGLKQYDKADADIRQLKTKVGQSPQIDYAEGLLYFAQQRYAEAQSAFEKVLIHDNNNYPALFYAGAAHYMQQHTEQAAAYLARFVDRNPNYIPALRMLAWLKLQTGDFSEAQRLIHRVVEQDAEDVFALNLLASALMQENKTTEGLGYFQQVVDLQPDSASARMNLGLGMILKGETGSGIEELEKAGRLQPESEQATIKIITIHLANKSYDEALEAALTYRENHPESITAHVLLGTAYMAKGDTANAGKIFEDTLEMDSGNITANSGLAAIALQAGQLDKAKEHYQDALEKHPGALKTLMNLAAVEAAQGNQDAMKAALEQAIASNPEVLEPRLSLSRYYFKTGEHGKIIELLSPLRSIYPDNSDILGLLGQSELAVRNYNPARSNLIKYVELFPNNADAHYALARAYAGLKDRDRSHAELNKVLELDENHVKARTALLELMLAEKNTSEARTHLEILKQRTDNQQDILIFEGRLAALAGDEQRAIDAYQRAFDKERINFNLLMLEDVHWKAGHHDDAVKLLESWMEEYPEDNLALLQLANRYLVLGQEEEATMAFTKVSELQPDNIIALNNLAWLYKDKNPDRAAHYAEKAYSLAPDTAEVIDTLAIVVEKSDTNRAEKLIEKALTKSPGNPTFLYHKAMILQEAGKKDQALQILQSLVEQDSPFPEKEEARRMLTDLGDL